MELLVNNAYAQRWLCTKAGVRLWPDQSTNLSFWDDKGLMGGFLFERYTGVGGSMHVHFAGRRGWISRRVLKICAIYAYHQAEVAVLIGLVRSTDVETQKIDERIGFRRVGVIPNYFPDSDMIVYQMTREECRWLPKNMEKGNGQEVRSAA